MFDWMTQFDRFSLSPDNVSAAEKRNQNFINYSTATPIRWFSNGGTISKYMRITCHGSVTRRSICSKSVSRRAVRCRCGERYFGPEALLFGIDIDDRCRQFDTTLMYASVRKMILHFCDPSYRKWAVLTLCLTMVATWQAIS